MRILKKVGAAIYADKGDEVELTYTDELGKKTVICSHRLAKAMHFRSAFIFETEDGIGGMFSTKSVDELGDEL